jgi:hypothetical protein
LFNPSSVANHIIPYLSLRIAFTVFEESPSLVLSDVKLMLVWANEAYKYGTLRKKERINFLVIISVDAW